MSRRKSRSDGIGVPLRYDDERGPEEAQSLVESRSLGIIDATHIGATSDNNQQHIRNGN